MVEYFVIFLNIYIILYTLESSSFGYFWQKIVKEL